MRIRKNRGQPIGIRLVRDSCKILSVPDGYPARGASVMAGDEIVAVDGVEVSRDTVKDELRAASQRGEVCLSLRRCAGKTGRDATRRFCLPGARKRHAPECPRPHTDIHRTNSSGGASLRGLRAAEISFTRTHSSVGVRSIDGSLSACQIVVDRTAPACAHCGRCGPCPACSIEPGVSAVSGVSCAFNPLSPPALSYPDDGSVTGQWGWDAGASQSSVRRLDLRKMHSSEAGQWYRAGNRR